MFIFLLPANTFHRALALDFETLSQFVFRAAGGTRAVEPLSKLLRIDLSTPVGVHRSEDTEQLIVPDYVRVDIKVGSHGGREFLEVDLARAIRVNVREELGEAVFRHRARRCSPEAAPDLVQPHGDVTRPTEAINVFRPALGD